MARLSAHRHEIDLLPGIPLRNQGEYSLYMYFFITARIAKIFSNNY